MAVPAYGYEVPAEFGPAAVDQANDPLVPPPGSGLTGWFDRLIGTLRRSWRPLGLILALTVALPQAVSAVVNAAAGVDGGPLLLTLVLSLATGAAGAIGWGAGIWVVTQGATGQPANVGEALRAGLRRGLPMWGYVIGAGVLIGVGLVLFVLPGLYLTVALSLFSYVVIFERGTGPIRRSLSLVNSAFWSVLGKVALLAVVGIVGIGFGVVTTAIGSRVLLLVGDLVNAALAVPVYAIVLVGLLVAYTQTRSRAEPLSTRDLWAAANSWPACTRPARVLNR